MPIYAYKCGSCGHAKDVLQKITDEPLRDCPACGASSFTKQVTAAGFQLKGSGWYVTDFRGGSGGGKSGKSEGGDKPSEAQGDSPSSAKSESPSASAGGCGASCTCH